MQYLMYVEANRYVYIQVYMFTNKEDSFISEYVCICIYIYTYIYIYISVYVSKYICTCIYTYIYTCIYIYIHVFYFRLNWPLVKY
jgi:hypothetical protein